MARYNVRGHARVEAIEHALEESGATILRRADPSRAPFEIRISCPNGQMLDLVCYAFTANEYRQKNRPVGEHRFQVKYGSDFSRYHRLRIASSRDVVTLFFGVHEELPLFIAADPAMHNPTWFSVSVEFSVKHLRKAKRLGWHGWERSRSEGRRKRIMPLEDLRTEVLVAFRPEHFLKYVAFEQVCTGLDPGERLLLSDKIQAQLDRPFSPIESRPRKRTPSLAHPLEEQFGLSALEILDVVAGRFRLLAAVRGSIAEHHLERHLRSLRGIADVERLDKDGEPDFRIAYRRRKYRIECKNVLRKLVRGQPRVDFQKTRASKGNPCSRYYSTTQFEILAACLHPVAEAWDFQFCSTAELPPHPKCDGRLSEKVLVGGRSWTGSLVELLEQQ